MIDLLTISLLLGISEPAEAPKPANAPVGEIQWLVGRWSGEGELFNNPVRMQLEICPVAGKSGFALDYRVTAGADASASTLFAGYALYWPSERGKWNGSWIGSNKVQHKLSATQLGREFDAIWSNAEVETGRTVYTLQDDGSLIVIDQVRHEDGAFQPFAKGSYQRAGDCG